MAKAIWSKTETACLIDLVAKNPAIWNTKAKEYMDSSKVEGAFSSKGGEFIS